jgi:hypothetical protein
LWNSTLHTRGVDSEPESEANSAVPKSGNVDIDFKFDVSAINDLLAQQGQAIENENSGHRAWAHRDNDHDDLVCFLQTSTVSLYLQFSLQDRDVDIDIDTCTTSLTSHPSAEPTTDSKQVRAASSTGKLPTKRAKMVRSHAKPSYYLLMNFLEQGSLKSPSRVGCLEACV